MLKRITFHLLVSAALLLGSAPPPAVAQQRPVRAAAAAGRPISEVLTPTGTLRPGATGSFDPAGYRVGTDPATGAPVFRPTGAGDENWQDGFYLPGTDDQVWAMAVASNGDVYIGGDFAAVGTVAANFVAKWNGTAWSALGTGLNSTVLALAVSGTDVYAAGGFTTAGGAAANRVAKWNGSAWSALGTGIDAQVNALAVSGADVYVGGSFTTAGGSPALRVAKWNGTAWSTLGTGLNNNVDALAVSGTDVYVGGFFTTAGGVAANRVAKWDGTAWSALGTGLNNNVRTLAVSGADVYVGGNFTTAGGVAANYIARWNGSAWSTLGTGLNSDVRALAVSGPDVYVVGTFTTAGGVAANRVAKWNGSAWSALGTGVNTIVYALAVSGANVYVGGSFATAGGATARNVAKWNGAAWSALGTGLNGSVSALAVSGSDVYVGGTFTQAGGVAANRVAKWNGSAWSALGSGLNNNVSAVAVSGTDVYVGGFFTTAGGVAANYVARWNGTAWSALGTGLNSNVNALAVSGADVYVGGNFTTAGGVAANYIAKWNGTAWSALGTGFNSDVYTVAVSGADVYVVGTFTTAGGAAANRVAKWNGTAWSALGTGLNNFALALAVSGADVYVGGGFTQAGGVAANRVAKWNGSAWSALGTGLDAQVNALAVSGADVYVGGSFTTAGGAAANRVAKWNGTAWSALGTGLNGHVYTVAMGPGSKVNAGGQFTTVGDGSKVTAYFGIYNDGPAAVSPTITSFSPASGPIGSSVTITGSGFNATAAQNIVFFGATRATVTAASATSLTVTVPLGATYQYLSVTNLASSLTAYSSKPFVVTLNGAIAFHPKTDFATGPGPVSIAIGDVDGDGKADLATANEINNTVSLYRNTSTAGTVSFAAKVDVATGALPRSVAIGDVDGDGKPDLATANYNGNTVSVLRNLSTVGTVSFATKVDYATGITPYVIAIGDVDGDGKPDLATTNFNGNTISVLRNLSTVGTVSFAAKLDYATGTTPYAIAIGDVDGDGKPELAVANYGSSSLSVFRNTSTAGSVSFAAKVDLATAAEPVLVAIGDVDGDGKPDLVTANYSSSTVAVLRNLSTAGTVSFAVRVNVATVTNPYALAISDLDGDGKPDLTVTNYTTATVSVIRNMSTSGTVSFAAKVDYTTGLNPFSLTIGDLDGDGKPDLAVGNYTSNTISVLRQADAPPVVTTFTPASGAIGSSVTITGSGFNATAAQNIVFFGATRATVTAASATSLTVTVPLGATYQYLSVTNLTSSLTGYSSKPFVVTLNGAIAFAPKVDATTGTSPRAVAIGDVDGDGKSDLAVANFTSNTVSVFRNTSTAGTVSFAAKVDYATGTGPFSVTIGDVDGDGKPDLATANYTSNTVSVFRNLSTSGTVSFAAKVDAATGTNPVSVTIGDVDGDGLPELAVANQGSNTVSVIRNTSTAGAVSFAAKVDYATGVTPVSVTIGDVDGDGKPDLALANNSSNTVSVLRNLSTAGTVSFAAKVDYATGTNPQSVVIGDVDGDGKPDLAVANYGSATVSVLRNLSTSGTVSFAAKVDYATGSGPISVSIGDVDGDGKPDLAVANQTSSTVSVLRNLSTSGTVSFAAKADYTTGADPRSVAIGDVDGDGKPDLAVANQTSNTVSVIRQVEVPVITSFSPASGPIGSSVTISGSGFNATAAQNIVFFGATRATVTAASSTSLTVTVPLGATYQYLSVTNLASSLTAYSSQPFIVTLNGAITFHPKVDATTGTTPYAVAIGDVDGDGKPDLAVPNYGSSTVSVFRNTSTAGTVSFAAKVDVATAAGPVSVAIGDMDGDGKPDLTTANYSSSTVSVLRNLSTSGTVSFATKIDYATGANPYWVSIGDVDVDGRPDLAVANYFSNTVSVLRNQSTSGTVSFAAKVDYVTGTAPYSVVIGDVDGDGRPDLATANQNSNTVSILRNQSTSGTVSFATKVDVATGTAPYLVVIGDVDGDGKPDLAVTNQGNNTVSVLRNLSTSGTVSFAVRADVATGANPIAVAIGDVDGDGKPDLAVTNFNSNTVSVLRNQSTSGTVSFAAKVDYATGTQPYSVAIGDVDGDGKPDLAVGNYSSNTVSVIRQADLPPVITSFSPASGPIGSSVTITGSGFNATAVQNIVFFGATKATVTAASATSLTVTVPLGATYQYLSVTNLASSLTAYSSKPFVVTLNGAVAFHPKTDATTGVNPYAVAIGDVDGDGKPDLAVANYFSNTVSVLRNTSTSGTVSFAAKVDYATGAVPQSVAIGDVDGDGKPDLAVTNYNSNTVSVLRNLSTAGTVSFAAKVDYATGFSPLSVAIGDVDGDGKPDLAVTNQSNSSNTVSVLRNTSTAGTVSFAAKVDYATGTNPSSVAIGDVDSDGKPDLAVANYGSSTVSVLRNLSTSGTISFAAKVDYATDAGCFSVALGDVDGDGKPDLATANLTAGNTVSVLRNTSASGTLSFAPKADYTTGPNPASVAIGDVDGDGKPDLAVANNHSSTNNGGTVSVLRNTSTSGTVSFAVKVDYTTGGRPYCVAIGDVDGDGKPDLATANLGSNTVSVLRQANATPVITSFTPTSGLIGTSVTVTGTDLSGATAVTVNGTAGSITANTATSLTFTVGAGSTTGLISVTTPNGTATSSAASPSSFTVTNEPTALTLTPQSVAENTGANAVVGTLSTTDADAGDTHTYTLVSGSGATDNALVNISGATLRLTASPNFEAKSSYAVRVRTTDQAGLSFEQTFTLTVTDVNEAPTNLALSPLSIAENTGTNVTVGTLTTTDVDAGDTFTYTLVSGAGSADNALVNISGDAVRITADPDFETKSSYAVRVRATDAGGLSFERAFTITITDVLETPANDTPSNIFLSNADVAENAAGAVVGLLTTADGDVADTHAYTLVTGAGSSGNAAFSILGNELRTAGGLDFEMQPSYSVRIRSTDNGAGALFFEKAFTITVTDVAESLTVSTNAVVPGGLYSTLTVTGTGMAVLGGPVQITTALTVQDGGRLNTACQPITGVGSFTLEAGATLGVCHPQGLSTSGATGAVQVTGTRSFAADATYSYNGTQTQVTGSGLPATVRELEAANTSGLTLTQPVGVTHVLRLSSGTLNTDGHALTLRSNATRTAYAVHAGGSTRGNVTVQRYVGGPAAVGYRHLSSPVQSAPVSDLTTTGYAAFTNAAYNALPTPVLTQAQFPTIFGFDEARTTDPAYAAFTYGYYSPTTPASTLTPGRGWSVLMIGQTTPDFVGALTTGDVPVNLTVTGPNASPNTLKAGWHLLGVPYAQPIDWDLATVSAAMSSSISVYRTQGGNSGQYLTRTNGTGSLPDGVVPVGQAFFARALSATTFTFTNALRVEANPTTVARSAATANAADPRPQAVLTLNQVGTPEQDEVYIYFENGATAGLDHRYDGQRPGPNTGAVPTLSALTGTGDEVAVNGLPETALTTGTPVELALTLPAAGTWVLAAAELRHLTGAPVTLLDRFTGTTYDLRTTPKVTFMADAGDVRGRFALIFGQRLLGIHSSFSTPAYTLTLYPNPASHRSVVQVAGARPAERLLVTDLAGRVVLALTADATGAATLPTVALTKGVYVVRGGASVQRLVVE